MVRDPGDLSQYIILKPWQSRLINGLSGTPVRRMMSSRDILRSAASEEGWLRVTEEALGTDTFRHKDGRSVEVSYDRREYVASVVARFKGRRVLYGTPHNRAAVLHLLRDHPYMIRTGE
jgi:hypothetical protein